ncbi:MAG: hypothetical protein F7C07_02435 [Desulfurococcales archaeon]|nr:hypothetical protein [Desulfurococcales archaeon]
MGLCESTKLLGCIVFSLSGLLLLSTIVMDPGGQQAFRLLGLILAVMSYSVTMLFFDTRKGVIATGLFAGSLLASMGGFLWLEELLLVSIALAGIMALLAFTGSLGLTGLSALMVSGFLAYTGLLDAAITRIALAASCIILGASSIIITGRRHSSLLAVSSLPMLLEASNWVVWLSSAITGVSLMLSQAGINRVSRCPFRTDSGLVFSGILFSVPAIAYLTLLGFAGVVYSIWVFGVILLMAGSLVPQRV